MATGPEEVLAGASGAAHEGKKQSASWRGRGLAEEVRREQSGSRRRPDGLRIMPRKVGEGTASGGAARRE